MLIKKCIEGHSYDSEVYGDLCPFCPISKESTIEKQKNNCNGSNERPQKTKALLDEIEILEKEGADISQLCMQVIELVEDAHEEFLYRVQEKGYGYGLIHNTAIAEIEIKQYSVMKQMAIQGGLPYAKYKKAIRDIQVRVFGEEFVKESFDRWENEGEK